MYIYIFIYLFIDTCISSTSTRVITQHIIMPGLLPILITLLVAFLVVKWFVNTGDAHPSARLNVASTSTSSSSASASSSANRSRTRRSREARLTVPQELINQVRSIAPTLHQEQIKYALELNNNDVQVVVEKYLNGANFPFPPNYTPSNSTNNSTNNNTSTPSDPRKISNIKHINLLQKFNITSDTHFNDSTKLESLDINERKQFMVWKARKNMELRLKNDDQLNALLNK